MHTPGSTTGTQQEPFTLVVMLTVLVTVGLPLTVAQSVVWTGVHRENRVSVGVVAPLKLAASMLAASAFRVASVVLGFSESVELIARAAVSVAACSWVRVLFIEVTSMAPNMHRMSSGASRANISATAPRRFRGA